ncbi:hypothetical protein [Sporosarcina jiandibaonis]|uniref:hypothetical protein n=1 Tax=Sporosarcina jiandibaonis TaxID=2715535 RepID=UPI0015526EF2|nr:hypothetical protein [Sporosarcina jiandibaonis]
MTEMRTADIHVNLIVFLEQWGWSRIADPETNKRFSPDLKVAAKVIEALHERGVICRAVTYEGTDISCFSPPLTINEEQVKTLVEKLHDAITSVANKLEVKI